MTARQKLELRLSEIRERLNAISVLEDEKLTEEVRAEAGTLQTEYRASETKFRAAVVAESAEEAEERETGQVVDAETRERRELQRKARVGAFVSAVLSGRNLDGASAEFADAVGCPGLMPLELLEAPEARAVTPGPAAETVSATRPTVPAAFSRTDAAALGISMPMVPPGEAHFPALTTAPPASPKAKDAAADATAAVFALTKRTPGRITGQFVIRVEDLALLPSPWSGTCAGGISSAMADSLDAQVIDGNGAGANLSGLFTVATDVAAAAAVETFATAIARFAGLVDGKHANGWGDIRALVGVATFAKYAAIFANADKGDISRLRSPNGQARGSAGFHPRSGRSRHGAERRGRPERARPADHGSGLARRGAAHRSVFASREGPAGHHGRVPGGLAFRSVRDRAGCRSPSEAELNGAPRRRRAPGRRPYPDRCGCRLRGCIAVPPGEVHAGCVQRVSGPCPDPGPPDRAGARLR